ncbi:MAG TPA: M20/M25/M40 family metallo-hydrolase [Chloroflexota bacterium]|nr:M20/M25/M40 family metallo-hydrolase [Chloroflexota bacterium]
MSGGDLTDRVLGQIDRQALARDCLAYVSVPSETGDETPGAHFLVDMLRSGRWEVELDEAAAGRPNVLTRIPGIVGGRTLLVNGHVDTIPIGKSWPARRDGDWIWGRGAEDMKAGLVAMVHAAQALHRMGIRLRGDLWLSGVVGHETPVGRKEGPLRLIERIKAGYIRPDAILICEGPCAIWRASLGSAIFHLTLRAAREPLHTLRVPYAENPVRALRYLLEEVDRLDSQLRERPERSLAGRDQLNVGIVTAGDYPNRLPTELRVTGTRRWGPGSSAAAVREELQTLAERAVVASGIEGLSGEATLEANREPFETFADDALVAALRRSGERVSGAVPEEIGLALVGDASLYANELGVPCAYYGPGYETAHSDNERVSIDRLVHIAQVYALTMMDFCGVAE